MIASRWQDAEASLIADAAGNDPAARELALRVYSARLIGAEPDLVLHGGGNSSLKARARDLFGDEIEVIHIKGSGWDLARIEARGLPAVRLAPLRRLRALEQVSDEDMINALRTNLLDAAAPNPSVETLLHAYLPQRVIDHTHATPMLVLANLPEARAVVAELFGPRLAVVEYVRPGYELGRRAAQAWEAQQGAEGLLLLHHGHVAWGETVRDSYERVLAQANLVQAWLDDRRPAPLRPVAALPVPQQAAALSALRRALGEGLPEGAPMPVMELHSDTAVMEFLARPDLASLARRGVATPDHVIRIKGWPVHLTAADVAGGPETIGTRVAAFVQGYEAYVARHEFCVEGEFLKLSPRPALAWVEGLGIVGIGDTATDARIAAELGAQNIRVMAAGEAAGGYDPLGEADLFDMEYWSLEQAKLGRRAVPPSMQGRVLLVTGGAGAIGLATAEAFAARGASIFLVDLNAEALARALAQLGPGHDGIALDITASGAPARAVETCVMRFGGLDILVSNAGAAISGDVATLPDDTLRQAFELNFFQHFAFSQAAVATFRAQGRGGQILFNVSKQAVNPGKGFAAYGLPKATTFFLLRQLALELGGEGVRVNGINADRIRSGLLTPAMISTRAAARGVDEATYLGGNLLRREVEARHVAEAFVALACSERTTGHVMTVDGGNIEAALR